MKHNMKRFSSIVMIPAMLIIFPACSDETQDANQGDVSAQDVREQAGRTVDTAAAFAQSTVEDYKQTMRARVDALNEDIQSIEDRMDSLSAEAKSEAQSTLDTLRTKRDNFMSRIESLSAQSESAWNELKSGVDRAWTELNDARKAALDQFGG